jgi:predicted alpha/beta superfamily hydrolase
VILPPSYRKESTRHYPVLYLMDGNNMALLPAYLLPRMWAAGLAPEGADNFMRAMKQDVIPFIERTYRADPAERGIGGHPLGGLISAHALRSFFVCSSRSIRTIRSRDSSNSSKKRTLLRLSMRGLSTRRTGFSSSSPDSTARRGTL